jgi:hypothetical protein
MTRPDAEAVTGKAIRKRGKVEPPQLNKIGTRRQPFIRTTRGNSKDRHLPPAVRPHHARQLDKIGTCRQPFARTTRGKPFTRTTRGKPVTRTTRGNSTRSAPAARRSPAPRSLCTAP